MESGKIRWGKRMNDKKLRKRINKIRDAMEIITTEINAIYNDNAESVEKIRKVD